MLRDVGLIFGYELRTTLRNPLWVVIGLFQPVLWLLLFAPLLQRAAAGASAAETLRSFTPGVLVMLALFGSLFAGHGMLAQVRAGVLERLAVSPVSRSALILGPALRDAAVMLVQALLLLGIAWLMDFRADPVGVLVMLALLALVGMLAATLSYALALSIRDENGLAQSLSTLSMPLLLVTGIVLPMTFAPGWLRVVAEANPLYHAVEAGRALFAGDLADGSLPVAFASVLVLTALTLRWSIASVRRLAG